MKKTKLETPRLTLRRWKKSDLEPLRRLNADPRVMEFYPETLSREKSDQIAERAQKSFEQNGFGIFALELKESHQFVGFVGLQKVPFEAHFTPAVEIGWRVAFEHWNRGYATEAAKEVFKHGFNELGFQEIVAMTFTGNHRSRRVMEKLNMTYSAKDDFDNPHTSLKGTSLIPHVLYRLRGSGLML